MKTTLAAIPEHPPLTQADIARDRTLTALWLHHPVEATERWEQSELGARFRHHLEEAGATPEEVTALMQTTTEPGLLAEDRPPLLYGFREPDLGARAKLTFFRHTYGSGPLPLPPQQPDGVCVAA